MIGAAQAIVELLVPDAVLRLLAAGIGFLAVAVAEAGVDAQGDFAAGCSLAQLIDHVRRAAIDVNAVLDDQIERFAIENIGRVDDRRRIADGRIPGRQSAADFAGADRVDQHAVAADQVEDRQVRAGLLGITDVVESLQVADPLDDLGRIVDEQRGAELAGQIGHSQAGYLGANDRKRFSRSRCGRGHREGYDTSRVRRALRQAPACRLHDRSRGSNIAAAKLTPQPLWSRLDGRSG